MFKFLIFIALIANLLACQSAPQKTASPEPVVESKIKQEPQTQPVQQKISEPDPQQVLYQQAMKSTQAGEIDKAIEQFTRVVKSNPSAKHAFTNLGLLYIHKNQNREAKEAFLNAIKQNKNDAIAYNHLAVIQRQQGEFKMSLFNYYKAIKADPDYANAHLNLGILLDIYLQDLPLALEQYVIFQKLTGNTNQQVEKWVIDIKRRIAADKGK
ncbi:MAG: tetratricopeptide repeat protein [Gammaproteobacteria bacterium]|jgi:tetratricopeptide (TPR) repeat protein|nr:tetratricopeptide repeat protein [Gammaproteobacteria bacterium]MBT3721932.1 tetratricopeptide repeat protein [Gammaproteobacteria bacterium]MBT4075558.1 tetratricopeptide repeat protein [Gammaproteobacteria bacterium]MBT4192974.1 tetratricopeptide repeat protein [Gammaproteobacteria bacterium]MBT4450908.1 tetratricopeptide repeat protein [Gammaproteobacteria bacterium]